MQLVKGWAPVFLISDMGYYKNREKKRRRKKSNQKGEKSIFFKHLQISNIVLNFFPHNIKVKHILCEMPGEKDMSSVDVSTVWK